MMKYEMEYVHANRSAKNLLKSQTLFKKNAKCKPKKLLVGQVSGKAKFFFLNKK